MNIKVLYFARLKEAVNYSTEDIDLPADVTTVTALKNYLSLRGDIWANYLTANKWCALRLTMR